MPVQHVRILVLAAALACMSLAAACGGGGGGTTPPPSGAPSNLQYASAQDAYREGAAVTPNTATWDGGAPTSFTPDPPLPAGLSIDQATGTISGTPTTETGATQHVITAANAQGSTQGTVTIAVFPSQFVTLPAGFTAETVHESLAMTPVKHAKVIAAPAGDGRVFFTEVDTGNVRVIDPTLGLLAAPFATVDVTTGGHHGLLGLALAPDFAVSVTPYLYVLACVPGDAMTVDRMQVLRYTAAGNVGTNETVVIDDLPVSAPMSINNGGAIAFDLAGNLFVSIGDINVPTNAQADTSVTLAGKVLRYDVSVVPAVAAAGNPTASDPEWCRGLRNTFGLAVHPTAGTLIGAENGPTTNDELNLLEAGRNFEWGGSPMSNLGHRIEVWPSVIVPTGLCWHTGAGWGVAYANNLFLTVYGEHEVRRLVMSGSGFVDKDSEEVFATLEVDGTSNHPLGICMAPDGSLYLSTFRGVYRIRQL